MTDYVVGDIVEVKSVDEIRAIGTKRLVSNGIRYREHCVPLLFHNDMMCYCGKRGQIRRMHRSVSGACYYTLYIDGEEVSFTSSVLKPTGCSRYWAEPRSNFDDSLICDWLSSF